MNASLSISNIVLIFVAILFSLGLHEAMHGFAAHWLGDPTAYEEGRLTLNPLKHVDLLTTVLLPVVLIIVGLPPIFAAKPVPFNPYRVKYGEFGAALIGLAGPFTNLALAIVAAIIARFTVGNVPEMVVSALVIFVQVNVGFFVFNMIPFPPLDGSRLLYAVAPEPVQRVMQQIEQAGIVVVIFLIIVLMPVLGPVILRLNDAVLRILL
jgi:Zn-dependent protease